jgi:bacteriocin-like protein
MRKKWGKIFDKGINRMPLLIKYNLINLTMKNLSKEELQTINGGLVPTSFYMDDDTIAQNGESFLVWGKIIWRTAKPFLKEIGRWIFAV